MLVYSPKTEHFEGGESRWVPIFPEVRPFLEELFEQAKPEAEYVITRYRDPNVNLRTQMEKIIRRAGLNQWPKLFQNLRATRETELAENYPAHLISAWLGHNQATAMKHYLQVTDDHFAKAVQNPRAATARNRVQGDASL
jgi:integrase